MNYYGYSRQPKDYSFAPIAAATAGQGVNSVMDIQDRERKRSLEDEELKNMKADIALIEQAREQRIVEAATEYMEAAGLSGDEGRNQALNVAMSTYYPPTGSEKKDPSLAAKRMNEIDQTSWPNIINRARMNQYKARTATQQQTIEGRTGAPIGNVGVEDNGVYRSISAPTSKQDYVGQATEEALREPYSQPTISREVGSQEAYDIGKSIYGPEMPTTIQADIGMRGKQELVSGDQPTTATMESVQRENLQKPIPTEMGGEYAKTYPKTFPPLDAKTKADIDMLNARKDNYLAQAAKARKEAGSKRGGASKDLTIQGLKKLNVDMSNTIRGYEQSLLSMRKDDENVPSIKEEVNQLKAEIQANQGIIRSLIKKSNIESEEPENAPVSEEAKNAAQRITEYAGSYPYKLTGGKGQDEFGNPSKEYNNKIAEGVVKFAESKGATFKDRSKAIADAIKALNQGMTAEKQIDYIINKMSGGR
jgi:hypothetical protein